ncbi:MAG: galactitol-1-phosphate 5-dehydrogenase [Victivallales bacterium]|nr:galactitol-1-phosphate 5-dehydrogenase [Victivallales bacterium]
MEIQDVPVPEVKKNEVLVKIQAVGICGSDVHGMDGSTGRRIPPIIMGHEAAGIIAATGADVLNWKEGERVTFDSTIYCGKCRYCRCARINLCEERRVLGVSCEDYRRNGTFAEYIAVPEYILYRLPDAVSFEEAALIEPMSVASHALVRSQVKIGDRAVVVGAGIIGLLVIQLLKTVGCTRIFAIDLNEKRLAMAEKFGADVTINAESGDMIKKILKLSDGGVDLAVECVGLEKTVNHAVDILHKGGRLTLVGNISPEIHLPLQKIVTRELNLNGSCASNGEYSACLELIANKRVNLVSLISAVAPLEEGMEYFHRLYQRAPELIKVILKP